MTKYLLLLLVLASVQTYGQNHFHYTYDAAGNRIKKEIVLPSARMAQATPYAEKEVFTILTDKIGEFGIKIYPNPTSGRVTVEVADLSKGHPSSAYLFNLQGMLLQRVDINRKKCDINLSSYPAGNYILKLKVDQKETSWSVIKL